MLALGELSLVSLSSKPIILTAVLATSIGCAFLGIFFISASKVFDNFLNLCANKRGEINASLISSKELSNAELDQINKDLSETMGSALKFDYKVDKSLIGGLKLQLGSFMIDTSIKNKLQQIENNMIGA